MALKKSDICPDPRLSASSVVLNWEHEQFKSSSQQQKTGELTLANELESVLMPTSHSPPMIPSIAQLEGREKLPSRSLLNYAEVDFRNTSISSSFHMLSESSVTYASLNVT